MSDNRYCLSIVGYLKEIKDKRYTRLMVGQKTFQHEVTIRITLLQRIYDRIRDPRQPTGEQLMVHFSRSSLPMIERNLVDLRREAGDILDRVETMAEWRESLGKSAVEYRVASRLKL